MIDRDNFIADTDRSIRKAALMLCGTDPRDQERWLADRSQKLRKDWARQFTTLTAAQIDTMVNNTMRRVVEKLGQLEARGVGMA